MPITASDVLRDASNALMDPDFVRWPLLEMLGFLNDGLIETVTLKPNAATKTVTLTLGYGTLQSLPDAYTSLSRVTRNLTTGHDEPGGPVGGRAITPIASRDLIDATIPDWHQNPELFGASVDHVIYDQLDPRRYFVVPGNVGGGKIEAVVGAHLTPVPTPAMPDLLENYTGTINLPADYKPALTAYVVYRAMSKDMALAGAAERAAAARTLFVESIKAVGAAHGALGAAAMTGGA